MSTFDKKAAIQTLQIQQMLSAGYTSIVTGVILSTILAYMQRDVNASTVVLAWLSLIVLVSLSRAILVITNQRTTVDEYSAIHARILRFRLGVLASGLVWGLASFLMFPDNDQQHQMLLVFMIAGLTAGGVASYSADLVSGIGYSILALMPLVIRLFIQDNSLSVAMSMAVMLYLGFLIVTLRNNNQRISENIVLRLDATDREEALRESKEKVEASEERYRLLLTRSPVGIFHYDTNLIVTYCNDRLADILHNSTDRIVGQDMKTIKDQSILPTLRRSLDGVVETYEGYYRATFSDANVWISMSCASIHDAIGNILGGVGIVEDITERKQAETQISKSLSLVHAALESTNDAILVVDLNNTWVLHNQRFTDLWHMPEEIIAAKDDSAALSYVLNQLEDADGFLNKVRELYADPEASSFDTIKFKNGIIFERYSMPQRIDGKVVGRVWSFRDVTERTRSVKDLQRESEKNLALLRNASDGIHILDTNGNIIEVSDSFCTMLGYQRDEMIGMNVSRWDAQFNDTERSTLLVQQFTQHGRSQFETRHRRKDGTIFDVEVSGFPLKLDGKPVLFNSSRDITERKQKDAALHESEERLKQAVSRLEEREMAKTRFLAAAGHDLRQPIAAASLFIDALKLTQTTLRQSEIINRLDQSMATFNSLLEALLNVSKLDAGMVKPQYTSISVAELFNWVELNFEPLATRKQLGFRLYFPMREMLVVHSDAGLVKSVLMNLVSNSIKFTSKGAILVSARRRAREVLFQVWDTGMGIPSEHIEHIFEEFYQINNPQRDRASGLGLGLSIVRRGLTLLGEEVKCRSKVGNGSVFEFRLPLDAILSGITQQTTIVASEEVKVNLEFMRGKRFVVVEDDYQVATAMIKLLEGMGGNVKCFQSAEDALRLANIGHADCYIADYMLGGELNGIQFLNQVQQALGMPIKAVVVTGDTSATFMRHALGCNWPVLYKPINTSMLITALSAQKEGPL